MSCLARPRAGAGVSGVIRDREKNMLLAARTERAQTSFMRSANASHQSSSHLALSLSLPNRSLFTCMCVCCVGDVDQPGGTDPTSGRKHVRAIRRPFGLSRSKRGLKGLTRGTPQTHSTPPLGRVFGAFTQTNTHPVNAPLGLSRSSSSGRPFRARRRLPHARCRLAGAGRLWDCR